MEAKLYAVAASHPCAAVERALILKEIPYRRIDIVPPAHTIVMRARFGARTVPGLRLDGQKVSGSRPIMRALDAAVPEPPLFPRDAVLRARVEEAEAWGDDVLQAGVRRLAWTLVPRAGRAAATLQEDARTPLPTPPWLAAALLPVLGPVERRMNDVGPTSQQEDLAALPGWVDHIDRLIADGVLGGDPFPNAADLQIGASMRLLLAFADLAPYAEGRPAAAHAHRAVPRFPGNVPRVLSRN